jgi:hypothetical protein
MKKPFCMLLCVLLLASLAVPAFALTVIGGEITADGVVYDLSYSGIRITFPAEFKEVEGVVRRNVNGKRPDRDLYEAGFLYYGLL